MRAARAIWISVSHAPKFEMAALSRERIRRARIALEAIARIWPEAAMSPLLRKISGFRLSLERRLIHWS